MELLHWLLTEKTFLAICCNGNSNFLNNLACAPVNRSILVLYIKSKVSELHEKLEFA